MGRSRRTALRVASAALALAAFSLTAPLTAEPPPAEASPAEAAPAYAVAAGAAAALPGSLAVGQPAGPAALVNPFVGTGGPGDVFPGADAPFGMLQWSPDTTRPSPGGGYSASSSWITGFSLTHMSGSGCRAAGDVPILPTLGAIQPGARDAFSHSLEAADAGYYSVQLADGIGVHLSATTRTGIAEFRFPAGRQGNLIFKLDGSQLGDSKVTFQVDSPNQVEGSVTAQSFCGASKSYTLHFVMRFSRPAARHGTFTSAAASGLHPRASQLSVTEPGPLGVPSAVLLAPPAPPGQPSNDGTRPAGTRLRPDLRGPVGAYVSFPAGRAVLAKVGISYVSAANATANLAAEDPGWSVCAVRAATQHQWDALLGKIAISGGSRPQRVIFYTALYHSLLAPSVFSDDNGQYTGTDGAVHTVDQGQGAEYTNFSGWDIYRTQAQLEALLDPAAASGAAQSLVDAYQQTGMLPNWPAYGNESYVMVGDPADAIIADYYAFGATRFNASAALAAMIAQGTAPSTIRPGLTYLDQPGYLPANGHYACCNYHAPVSTTLEYDVADFAISALAEVMGNTAAEQAFRNRAQDWRNLLNPRTGLMQPRLSDGGWQPGFQPTALSGFAEGDSWQYTGMVPFDLAGLAAAKGGRAAMTQYLNQVLARFTSADDGLGPTADMGNEPSIELPWEYDYVGEPYATQRTVRAIQDQLWRDTPGGIPGNDDLGAMSAWFVWSALGMYPMTPGTATIALGSPLFSSAVIRLSSGGTLRIIGSGARTSAPYVRSATWNGSRWTRAYAPAAAITRGGTLDFRLGGSPSRHWAARPDDAPPSYGS
jgi:predicted alpha-1,2-mannosidase